MFTPLILFFGLTVATAVIAHWSDNLGKKLGKKRVSLMGLRPRTTATVLTIASSWCIMLFTLGAMLLAVRPLRNALFSYDKERAQAESDRVTAKNDIEAARGRIKNTQIEFDTTKSRLDQAQSNLAQAKAAVSTSRQAAKDADQAAIQAKATGKKAEELAHQQTEVAEKRVAIAQKNLDEAQAKLFKAQKANASAQKQLATGQRLSRQINRNLNIAQKQYEQVRLQYSIAQKNLYITEKQRAVAKRGLYTVTKRLYAESGRLLKKEVQLKNTARQLKNTEQQLTLNSLVADAFLANDAPVKVNQVFAASRVVANQSTEALVAQLRALLQQGQQYFVELEDTAPTPSFPPDATLQLAPRDVLDGSRKLVRLQGEPLLRFLADAMASQTTANLISVRLVALRNHLEGERSIAVQFVFVPIKPAFAAGEVLASSTIDGAQGDARIFRSLLDLTDLGELEAKKRGVDPPKSPDATDFYAKDTRDKIFEALRRIEGTKSRLSVNLVTARALTTVEQLQVRFEIEGQPLS